MKTLTDTPELRRRLMHGLGATSLGPFATAFIQLGTVPVLLGCWGAEKYGDWLLLSAVPSYLALSDLGFGNASGSDMTMLNAAGDRRGALRTFQSSWVLLSCLSLLAILLASCTISLVPWQTLLRLSAVSSSQASRIILVLATYAVVGQQNSVLESGYRCDGNFAAGTVGLSVLRLTEATVSTAVAVMGGSLLAVASTYLIVRSMGVIAYRCELKRRSPWLKLGFRYARRSTLRRLAAPALGFMVYPASQALSMQGFTILIGALAGPVAVVSFSATRTMTRVGNQLLNTISSTIWPVLSTAFGENNIGLARQIHRRAFQLSLAISALTGLLLWLLGPRIFALWLHGNVAFELNCFHILLAATVINAMWFTSFAVLMSNNTHHGSAFSYLLGTTASLPLACLLLRPFGLAGPALALLFLEFWMSTRVLTAALKQLSDTPRNLLHSVFSLPAATS